MGQQRQYGIILKGIGGFYYVKTAYGVLECRAKGIFRKRGITPQAGDRVEIEQTSGDYTVVEICERKNCFLRPPVANVDNLIIVVSSREPSPNRLVLDKLLAIAAKKGVKPVIAVTKTDVENAVELIADYTAAGFEVVDVRNDEEFARKRLGELAKDALTVFEGNSGVGKSTLINFLDPDVKRETADISKKLGRGKHTTRAVELYDFLGGYLVDTPGFSAVDVEKAEPLKKEELEKLFPEFGDYLGECRYVGCSHVKEKGCAVREAFEKGEIVKSRYENYCELYKAANELNDWEIK